MKILLLVSVILTLAYPQTAEWLNPHPTGAELRKVKVLSNGTIHAGGEGMTFLTSKDSGKSWNVQTVRPSASPPESSFSARSFISFAARLVKVIAAMCFAGTP